MYESKRYEMWTERDGIQRSIAQDIGAACKHLPEAAIRQRLDKVAEERPFMVTVAHLQQFGSLLRRVFDATWMRVLVYVRIRPA